MERNHMAFDTVDTQLDDILIELKYEPIYQHDQGIILYGKLDEIDLFS